MEKEPIRFTTVFLLLGVGICAAWGWRRISNCRPYVLQPFPERFGQQETVERAGAEREARGETAGQVAAASTGKLPRFSIVIMVLGALALLAVLGDLLLRGFRREVEPPVWETSWKETDPGRDAIVRYGCGGCHVVPGIRHATGRVGPQLHGFRDQMFIAGVLPNVPENLVAWIQNPKEFNPRTAMPNLRVTEEEARSIAIYLYAQP
jgi:cytochrome c